MFRRRRCAARIAALALAGLWAATALAQEAADPDLSAAAERIAQHRQADAVIVVVDAEGNPVPGAQVKIEQAEHAFKFGSNIFLWGKAGSPGDEQTYRDRFADVFNFATLPFYWPAYEPRQGQPQHENREAIARWCLANGITPKGHPLAWNYADARWFPDDLGELQRLQMARIDEIVARFKGLVDIWDVVNEPTHIDREEFLKRAPKMTAMWQQAGRDAFILEAFRHARAAHPEATLLINDYRTDPEYAKLIQGLIDQSGGKPPFDVIGIQSHMHGGTWTNAEIWERCERFAAFGLPLHFTELTIVSGKKGWELAQNERQPWPSTTEGEAKQADEVERVYTMLFSHPAVEAITWWDFADRGAWQQAPAGFLRRDLTSKPSYDRLHSLIKKRWWTRATVSTDAQGQAPVRAFLGAHRVRVQAGDRTAEASLSVLKNADNRITVTLP